MRRITCSLALLLLAFCLPLVAHAQDPNFICCNGLAPPGPGTVELPLVSKFPLDTRQVCPPGTAVKAISFSHAKDQNLTFQESFALQCVASPSMVSNTCSWGGLTSKFPLTTKASAPPGSVVTGVRFTHNKDQNFTFQESYAVLSCTLSRPPANLNPFTSSQTTKFHLQSHAGCELIYAEQPFGVVTAIGFSHAKDANLTYQENAVVDCLSDLN